MCWTSLSCFPQSGFCQLHPQRGVELVLLSPSFLQLIIISRDFVRFKFDFLFLSFPTHGAKAEPRVLPISYCCEIATGSAFLPAISQTASRGGCYIKKTRSWPGCPGPWATPPSPLPVLVSVYLGLATGFPPSSPRTCLHSRQ